MARSALRWRLDGLTIVAAVLLLLLVVLAGVQYRWLGQVSAADRARLNADVRRRAEALARDFDREVTRAFFWLSADEPGGDFQRRYEGWRRRAAWPDLVESVLLVDLDDEAQDRCRKYDPATGDFAPADWPPRLASWSAALTRRPLSSRPSGTRSTAPGWGPAIGDPPALVRPVISWSSGARSFREGPLPVSQIRIVLLDEDVVRDRVLPALVRRHFGAETELPFLVRVLVDRGRRLVYTSAAHSPPRDDAVVPLLGLRPEELSAEERQAIDRFRGEPSRRWSYRPERWSSSQRGRGVAMGREWRIEAGHRAASSSQRGLGLAMGGEWRLEAGHRAASVDAIVVAARSRNMAVSFGILSVLGAAGALLVVSARRFGRLARRQMAFVATVAHELRTPVAVIGSAAENLADGVIREPEQVRAYGAMVRDEARRLGALVEQALDLARVSARPSTVSDATSDVATVVSRALDASHAAVDAGGFVVDVAVDADLPPVRGERDALARALRNLIDNAVRYSGESRWLRVSARRGKDGVRVAVEDRGVGLGEDERTAVLEPFVRGRHALDRQIHGTGLGLAVVRAVVDGVGGRVEVESTAGAGSTFTIVLPEARVVARQPGREA